MLTPWDRKNYNKFTIATLAAYDAGLAFELVPKLMTQWQ
jgi:hypothetical protein